MYICDHAGTDICSCFGPKTNNNIVKEHKCGHMVPHLRLDDCDNPSCARTYSYSYSISVACIPVENYIKRSWEK